MSIPMSAYEVELPAGGKMWLESAEEVELWEKSSERYIEDYHLTKTNDLVLLGAILQQQLETFRAQRLLNGLRPEMDANGVPTGKYEKVVLDSDDRDKAMKRLNSGTSEIRGIEKALGIDKVTRESGGQVSVSNYLRVLKHAAHERAIHVSKRTLAYEAFVNDLRWRLRVLFNTDAEDRAYHDLTPDKLLQWCDEELKTLEQVDQKFAKEKGKLFIGKL
jgi:hypothetical protein